MTGITFGTRIRTLTETGRLTECSGTLTEDLGIQSYEEEALRGVLGTLTDLLETFEESLSSLSSTDSVSEIPSGKKFGPAKISIRWCCLLKPIIYKRDMGPRVLTSVRIFLREPNPYFARLIKVRRNP